MLSWWCGWSQAGTMYCLTLKAEGVRAGKGWERHCTLCGLNKAEWTAGGKAGSLLTEWCGSGGRTRWGWEGKPSAGNEDEARKKGREEEERKDGRRLEGEKLMKGVAVQVIAGLAARVGPGVWGAIGLGLAG